MRQDQAQQSLQEQSKMGQKYTFQGSEQHTAKALGKSLPISTKHSIEICKAIKGRHINNAKKMLEKAAKEEEPISFTRFTEGAGHKPNIGMGKFPVKACKNILQIVESAEANAQNQGLSSDLKIISAVANEGPQSFRYGRHRGRKEKSTHVEIVVREVQPEEPEIEEVEEKETESEETQEKEESEDKEEEGEDKEIPARSTIENKTKDEIKEYASEEWNIELSTNDLKDEMIDQLFEEIGDNK